MNRTDNTLTIDRGTNSGANLYHSFREFSLPSGSEVFFNNPTSVRNIITRVTGGTVSDIDGTLRANGTANLFLINPAGIVFGPGASLQIGGSFLATTANSVLFSNGSEFSAIDPREPPLLTIDLPIGLRFGSNSGTILARGPGHTLQVFNENVPLFLRDPNAPGLRVFPGNTLALVGSEITLDGAILTADGGRIELGGARSGTVSLTPSPLGWELGYDSVESFGDIAVRSLALVDASGFGSGGIQLQGRSLSVADGSVFLIQNFGNTPAGDIFVRASESLEILGTNENSTVRSGFNTQMLGAGAGGNISVSTRRVSVRNGASISARTFSSARGGRIDVNASDSIELVGFSPVNSTFVSFIATTNHGSGNSGDVLVTTDRLLLLDGPNIGSASVSEGSAGTILLNVADSVQLIGFTPSLFTSAIFSSSLFEGNAGDVTINTARLAIRDSARVDASTFGSGSAASVIINASESVELGGVSVNSLNPARIISSANILDPALQKLFGLPPEPTGNSGNLIVNTPRLTMADGSQITVRHDGTGNAGNLRINADIITLTDRSGITASTVSGRGGNITLNARDLLSLRGGSLISATSGGTGDGGNININAGFLVAFPNQNNDITANAFGGRGGAIEIETRGIFGTGIRRELTPDNDITAFSLLQPTLDGVITLNTPELDPSRGTIEFPTTVVDPDRLIAQNYCKKGTRSELTLTGRGGIPTRPADDLDSPAVGGNLIEPVPTPAGTRSPETSTTERGSKEAKTGNPVLPARGWVYNERGEVVLIAYSPDITENQRSGDRSAIGCPVP